LAFANVNDFFDIAKQSNLLLRIDIFFKSSSITLSLEAGINLPLVSMLFACRRKGTTLLLNHHAIV